MPSSRRGASSLGRGLARSEFHFGSVRWCGAGERRSLLLAANGRTDARWKLKRHIVVLCNSVDVTLACDGDSVLGAFKLHHEIAVGLGRFQVRIRFRDREQSPEGARELILRLLELLEAFGIIDDGWI